MPIAFRIAERVCHADSSAIGAVNGSSRRSETATLSLNCFFGTTQHMSSRAFHIDPDEIRDAMLSGKQPQTAINAAAPTALGVLIEWDTQGARVNAKGSLTNLFVCKEPLDCIGYSCHFSVLKFRINRQ